MMHFRNKTFRIFQCEFCWGFYTLIRSLFLFLSIRIYIPQFTLYCSSVQVEEFVRIFLSICFGECRKQRAKEQATREREKNFCVNTYTHKYVCFETTL